MGVDDGAVDDGADEPTLLVLSPRTLVTVGRNGIQLERSALVAPLALDLAGLHLLALLSAEPAEVTGPAVEEAARRAGVERAHLRELNLMLRVSGYVEPRGLWEHPPAPDHPDVAGIAPFDLSSEDLVAVRTPLTLRLRGGRFEVLDHQGFRWLALDPAEAAFVALLADPAPASALVAAAAADPAGVVGAPRAAQILALLDGAGLLRRGPSVLPEDPTLDPGSDEALSLRRDEVLAEAFRTHFAEQNEREAHRRRETGEVRPRVIPVAFDLGVPAGVTMILAYARSYEDGLLDEAYELRTDWVWNDDHLDTFTAEPAIYLFSNYLWSHHRCLEVSRRIKELSPDSITVHGGPDTPKYEADVEAYFAKNPHVDVTVRGEGEATAAELLRALRDVIGTSGPDLSVLSEVEGLTYRTPSGPVRTADRDRIADLDTLPSPFLTGMVDVYAGIPETMVTLETNRGCPYGCTFCDWGSATTSRVRKFELDRVYADLEWCVSHEVTTVSVADANFGMLARDVEIAEEVARLRSATGYPKSFGVSYAKNTVKHLQHIIGILAGAHVMTQGVLSLQTMDADTLQVIHRSNIKTERYDALANSMREAKLPLMVELMMGLPGQTLDSFANDLQQCIEREVPARINRTTLLVNSPMNAPEYLAEHQVKTHEPLEPGRNALVISSATFTEDDWREMERLRVEFGYFENYGVLRILSRYVRHHAGVREIDLYRELGPRVAASSGTWPALEATITHGSEVMAPIYSWAVLMDELASYLEREYGVTGSGIQAVLSAQQAILPAAGRRFPARLELEHDVVAWFQAVLAAKSIQADTHWTDVVPQLEDLPPGVLVVEDPDEMSDVYLGLNPESMAVGVSWELESPLSRARIAAAQLPDWLVDGMMPDKATAGVTPVQLSAGPTPSE